MRWRWWRQRPSASDYSDPATHRDTDTSRHFHNHADARGNYGRRHTASADGAHSADAHRQIARAPRRLSRDRDAVDHRRAVIGNQQRAIGRDGNSDRATQNITLCRVRHQSGHERDGTRGWLAVLKGYKCDLVTGAGRAVPRSMLGNERATAIAL